MKQRLHIILTALIALLALAPTATAQRRITPVNNAATATQPINETKNDTARINAARRATMQHYHDDKGRVVYIDTVTGREWIDSTAVLPRKVPMKYPLLCDVSVGLNIWDPVMRIFGQSYGIADAFAQVNLHNRYFPTLEVGLGAAKNTPEGLNYTYRSPMSVYMRIGADYNFLYNSNPDYKFFAGMRYGFAPFNFSLSDITAGSDYWGDTAPVSIPSQSVTAGWLEISFGLRVKLWGPISAGWAIKYHAVLHRSKTPYGKPWYIPGYGSRNVSISGAFNIVYTLPLRRKQAPQPEISPIDTQTQSTNN